ncbi:MAG: Phosphoadenosine phosphosulfate reductase family protein [Candidatus Tokpelaia hoelldobleri]|uniref:Phosphoadenosine phosphosulfate reductase family protein n=1 Tax=Candidatus Tokpelaia hoelldobleri TaxID=1902579 RepID=A0A1U9JTP8_9HYPH|nr:MAG: Phosphoadenosine phosphosulfate reductase family protein [Candidatus Tokpelaia hoelldoblerii]
MRYLEKDVYKAACERIDRALADSEFLYVSFSGGKDSGVLLNLAVERAEKMGRRIGIFHIDYEAQYQATTDYVARTLEKLKERCSIYHVCLPLSVPCATSMHQKYWIPWNQSDKSIWVRDMPANTITEDNAPPFFKKGMRDYDFQSQFGIFLKKKLNVKSVACLVGIRAQESLNRWRVIGRPDRVQMYNGLKWTRMLDKDVFNAYPLYDWHTEDIWTANAKSGWDYNSLYDLLYQAGIPLHTMRVASPFIETAIQSLHLYRAIEPHTWGKLVGRVNGVNFSGIYGGTTAMGWRSITKPRGHTWRSYAEFLLSTLPKDIADNYRRKIATSIKFWRERGGLLPDEAIEQIRKSGHPIKTKTPKMYKSKKKAVMFEDYPDDMETNYFRLVPSWKRFCVCIMKNDHLCKYMGFAQTKTEIKKRQMTLKKYEGI